MTFAIFLFAQNIMAGQFLPENQVQAALLGVNMLGQSELLCYKEFKIDYSSIVER